jgi:hypothetical protein
MERIMKSPTSPQARGIAVVYLLYFLVAFLSAILTKGLVVPDNAAATANNILTHEPLYRAGLAADLIANALYLAVTALFYGLFEPVSRRISLLAAFLGLVGCTVQIFGGIFRLASLVVLGDGPWSHSFNMDQLQAVAFLCIKLHAGMFNFSLVLFALYDLLLGWLIFKSTFLPRALGVLLIVAGLGWLTFVWPPLATALVSYVLPLGALAEIVLMLWLLVRGVNVPVWKKMASSGQEEGE